MLEAPLSGQLEKITAASMPFLEFLAASSWSRRMGADDICDFVVGNPHDMPLPGYLEAIGNAGKARHPNWFGYKTNEPEACRAAAQSLRERLGINFDSQDIFMTKGASNALVVVLSTILDPEDEVIFLSPPWFFYEPMIRFARGTPVRARVDMTTFDVDVDAIAEAITPRTRAVIVNSPNNPTGKIYPADTLTRMAEMLQAASNRYGRAIYLISDESYNRIIFDDARFRSPTAYYPYSFLIYSYAKALLAPGQRLGYIALPPTMPESERMRRALFAIQCSGYGFPDAVQQYAVPDLEKICIDLKQLQRRRDVLMTELRHQGYEVNTPDGAWYLLVRSPMADDVAFAEQLAEEDIFVLPGRICEMPGYLRICLTANDSMVERSLGGFARAMRKAETRRPQPPSPKANTAAIVARDVAMSSP